MSPAAPSSDSSELRLRSAREQLGAAAATRSIAKGLLVFGLAAAAYAATWAGIFLVETWWLKLLLAWANGHTIGMLFVIGHDACHQALTPSPRLNRLLGRLAFLPALHPYTAWECSHNTLHHGFTNLKTRDPGYPPFSRDEFVRLPAWRRALERIYRTAPGLTLYYLVENWWRIELFPSAAHRAQFRGGRRFRFDQATVLLYGGLVLGLAFVLGRAATGSVAGGLAHVAAAWVLPFLIWNGLFAFVTFQQHTHPRVRWFDNEAEWTFFETQVRGTVHVAFPTLLRLLLHNINEHTAHHINPRVPLYELKSSQDGVRQALPDDVLFVRWSPRFFLETLRCCKLYDYRNHCWLDFDGRPTTPGLSGSAGCPATAERASG